MKKIIISLIGCFLTFCTLSAQTTVDKKVEKEAQKEAKRLQKEGWECMDGSPIDKAICLTRQMEAETLPDGSEKYLKSSEIVKGKLLNTVRSHAESRAQASLVSSSHSYVKSIQHREDSNSGSTFELDSKSDSKGVMRNFQTTLLIFRKTADGYEVQITMMVDKNDVR